MTTLHSPTIRPSRGLQAGFVILATLGGGLLRFNQLGAWSFWIDEINSIRDSLYTLQQILTGKGFPLFFLLNKGVFNALGVTEFNARLLPAIFGVVTIPTLFYLTRRLFNPAAAFIATTLLAISPWHIYWSQNARFYTLLLLLYSLALLAFYWGIERDNFRYILLGLVIWLLAVFTHTTAALLVPVISLYFLALKFSPGAPPPGLKWRNIIPFLALPMAGYGLFELVRVGFLGADWLIVDLIRVFVGAPNHSPLSLLDTFFYRVGLAAALLALVGGAYLVLRGSRPALLLSINAVVPILVFTLLSPFTFSDIRYAFISLPSWFILAGAAVPQLLEEARANRLVYWLPAIFPLAMLVDHGVEDLRFYLSELLFPGTFFLLSLAPLAVLVPSLLRSPDSGPNHGRDRPAPTSDKSASQITPGSRPDRVHRTAAAAMLAGVFLTLFAHPLLLDYLYYRHQHGHRSDWRGGAQTISDGWQPGDLVLTLEPRLAAFYLGERPIYGREWLPADLPASANRIWVVEVWGMHKIMPEVVEWSGTHCSQVAILDNLAAGRNFEFRVHRCDT